MLIAERGKPKTINKVKKKCTGRNPHPVIRDLIIQKTLEIVQKRNHLMEAIRDELRTTKKKKDGPAVERRWHLSASPPGLCVI